MEIKSNSKQVIVNGVAIYSSSSEIDKVLESNDQIYILFKSIGDFNQNVISIDLQGNLIWRIEALDYPEPECHVTNLYFKNNELFVYRWCGFEEKINMHTGSVISSNLIK